MSVIKKTQHRKNCEHDTHSIKIVTFLGWDCCLFKANLSVDREGWSGAEFIVVGAWPAPKATPTPDAAKDKK